MYICTVLGPREAEKGDGCSEVTERQVAIKCSAMCALAEVGVAGLLENEGSSPPSLGMGTVSVAQTVSPLN